MDRPEHPRPALRTMPYPENLHPVRGAVDHDMGCPGDHRLSCPLCISGSTHAREESQRGNPLQDPPDRAFSGRPIVPGNVSTDITEAEFGPSPISSAPSEDWNGSQRFQEGDHASFASVIAARASRIGCASPPCYRMASAGFVHESHAEGTCGSPEFQFVRSMKAVACGIRCR